MIYGILSTIAFIIILPFWLILGIFKTKLVYGFKEKCGFYKNGKWKMENGKWEVEKTPNSSLLTPNYKNLPTLLFYGVSVGEVIAMENLIKKTREIFPDVNIILLTGTKTGQELAHKKLGEICDFISYFPFDFPFCVNNMLKKLKPDAIFVMETELWPNFSYITNNKKIPFYIINARISDRTYKSYKRLSFFFAPILKRYTAIFPQSEQDSTKLISIGANPETTTVMGNLKFDIKNPGGNGLNFSTEPQHKIILAGSTHSGEEKIILGIFNDLKKEIPNLKLIIAPRHPERNEKVFELMKNTGFICSKRSDFTPHPNQPLPNPPLEDSLGRVPQGGRENLTVFEQNDIILLDTMGELGKFYSVCDVAFIGGSFPHNGGDNKSGKGVGGHNPLEATIFNKPVVSGPSTHNFKDIYAILTSTDCAKITNTSEELKNSLKKLLTDEEFYQKASKDCEKVFEQNKGALNFVLNVLKKIV